MKTKFALLLLTTLALAAVLFLLRDLWSLHPYEKEASYSNISRVAMGTQGTLYTVTDSKRMLLKVDGNGELVYALESNAGRVPGTIQLFNSITSDEQGNAYALLTVLDSYGLKVSGERIIKISPDGSRQQVMYRASYPAEEVLLRVGKIQSLTVTDGFLHFFRQEKDSATMDRLSVAAVEATPESVEVLQSIAMPGNRYVSELTGSNPQQYFFTSKRGRLYSVNGSDKVTQLYPATETVHLNFPVQVTTSDGVHVYFIDYHEAAVQQLDSSQATAPVHSILRMSTLAMEYPEIEWSDFTHLNVGYGMVMIATSEHIIQVSPNGTIQKVANTYRYPPETVWFQFGYWGLIAAAAAMLLYTIRYAFIHLMKRRVSLLIKQLGVIVPIILAAMVVLLNTLHTSFSDEMKNEMRSQLEMLAGNGKYLVDGANLERLNTPSDFMSGDYVAIKHRMNDLFSHGGESRNGLYSTIYRYVDGSLYIIMDDDDSVTMFRPFSTSEENLPVLEQGSIVSGEWEDASGEWMYALGPLYGSNGDIIGIYETGKDMNVVQQNNLQILSSVLGLIAIKFGVILIVVTLMTVYLLSSIRRLRRSVNLIAGGEWDTEVNIRTRDEVAELGERFNMMASSIRNYIREITTLSESYVRFVPQQFLNVLGKGNMTQVRLGDQVHRRMTVMVSNMRNFSDFSMSLTPEDNFRFINSFLKVFGPVVRQHGGFTSRYLGPGMLALFPNDPVDAIKAAVKMRSTLETYNGHRNSSGYQPIDIGISVHIGDMMIGIIGEEQRMEGSVVSDQVELATELEKASAKLGASVLVTEEALRSCKKSVRMAYRRLGAVQLHGEKRTLELYDVYEADTPEIRKLKRETQAQFEEAVELYRNGRFYDAREAFVSVVKKNRWDLAAKLYFHACDTYYQQGVTSVWNGSLRIS